MSVPPVPSDTGSKVPIPRLEKRKLPPTKAAPSRERVAAACLSCRARKIRCNGARPTCQNCSDSAAPCVYLSSRRNRLKTATEQNQDMILLLRELREKAEDSVKRRIDDTLTDVLVIARMPARSLADILKVQGDVAEAASNLFQSPGTDRSIDQDEDRGEANVSAEAGSNDDLDILDEDILHDEQSRATGFVGKNSEIQWMKRLHQDADGRPGSSRPDGPWGPPGNSVAAEDARLKAMHTRQEQRVPSAIQINKVNFYLDDENLELDILVTPHELPPFDIAEQLMKVYFERVHNTFPILAKKTFLNQFYQYYASVSRYEPYRLPNTWQAILNMVFAIAAVYAHLTEMPGQEDPRSHLIYHYRAWELNLKSPWWFTHPDMPRLQLTSLLAFYYFAVGHINRSWIVSGMSLRFGYALGLHLRNEDPTATAVKKEVLARIWWAIYGLEGNVSNVIGRPSTGMHYHCSVPPPLPLAAHDIEEAIIVSRFGIQPLGGNMHDISSVSSSSGQFANVSTSQGEATNSGSYLKYATRVGMIVSKALSDIYSPRISHRSWESVQHQLAQLSHSVQLETWLGTLPAELDFRSTKRNHAYTQEQNILELHYYSAKILLMRPCLCRLDRRIKNQTQTSNDFNQRTAKECVQAARAVADLLPDDPEGSPTAIYTIGPWWSMVHYIMQSLAVLLLEMSYHEATGHSDRGMEDLPSLSKLLSWLRVMGARNKMASRAYRISLDLTQKLADHVDVDISDLIATEQAAAQPEPDREQGFTQGPSKRAQFGAAVLEPRFPEHPLGTGVVDPDLLGDVWATESMTYNPVSSLFFTTHDEENPFPVDDTEPLTPVFWDPSVEG